MGSYYKDGLRPDGCYEITCYGKESGSNAQTYILDTVSFDTGSSKSESRSANGEPNGFFIQGGLTIGSADLQLLSRTQSKPSVGDVFTATPYGVLAVPGDTFAYAVESVGDTFTQGDVVKVKISFTRCVNPAILVPALPQTFASGAAITAITCTSNETTGLTWSATGLPAGLSISGGSISGTPTTPGTYTAYVKAESTANKIDGRNRATERRVTFTIT